MYEGLNVFTIERALCVFYRRRAFPEMVVKLIHERTKARLRYSGFPRRAYVIIILLEQRVNARACV